MTCDGSEERPAHGKLATLLVAMVVVAACRGSPPPEGKSPPAPDASSAAAGAPDASSAAAGVPVAQGSPSCVSFNIRSAVDWTDFVKAGCTTLSGDLRISTPDLAELSAPSLRRVQGDLVLHLGPTVTRLDLPVLEEVGARVIIEGESALKSVVLPALKTARGGFAVTGTSLTTLEVPVFARVGGQSEFDVDGNSLVRAGLEVRDNATLQSLHLPMLRMADSSILIKGNAALTVVSLPLLTEFRFLSVEGNEALTLLELPMLERGGDRTFRHRKLEAG